MNGKNERLPKGCGVRGRATIYFKPSKPVYNIIQQEASKRKVSFNKLLCDMENEIVKIFNGGKRKGFEEERALS